tara:strand:- start:1475 stop:2950 length:1476 start_codon:yes stop_codon:yes gene_type:complete
MVKNNDSSHQMVTRSKTKVNTKSKSETDVPAKKHIKKRKAIAPKRNLVKQSNDDDVGDDNFNELAFLLFLLQKLDSNNLCNIKYVDNEYKIEEIDDDENIIDDNDEEEIVLLENNLLNVDSNDTPFKHKILRSNLADETKRNIINNINYFNTLSEHSSEYQKMKTWIMNLEQIPFDNYIDLPVSYNSTGDKIYNFLKTLQTNLNKCIYGQIKAKESILQIVTQIITNPKSTGSIIALKGPPGVGKTSLIKNGLAKALNLPFGFITLGGINDSSYFDGFSYTYEGSKYGKICDVLIKTGCMNPIIFMDELDKVSNTDKGDEINNLLIHITDFTQNNHFEDKYFSGIPLDLSKAIFIFSLNNDFNINPILKDRLNIINLDEFQIQEKVKIALNYLIPEIKSNIGIKDSIQFDGKMIEYIILNYCSTEQGVRELKRCIETIFRKINVLKYSKDLKLDFKINEFKFPFNINKESIDELLKDRKKKDTVSQLMMYT